MIVCAALATSTGWLPKLRCAGEKVGFTRIPLPERLTFCGLLEAASAKIRDPVRVPVCLGVNTTPTTQFALAARLVPLHPSLETLKSPEVVTVLTCAEKLFGLVRVTLLAAEVVSTSCSVNASAVGLTVNFPIAVGVAVGVELEVVDVAVGVAVRVAVAVAVDVRVVVAVAVAL